MKDVETDIEPQRAEGILTSTSEKSHLTEVKTAADAITGLT